MTNDVEDTAEAGPPLAKGMLGAWWRQGWRSLFLLRPDWRDLHATPAIVLALVVVATLMHLLVERVAFDGQVMFYWPAMLNGWFPSAVLMWLCWLVGRHPHGSRPPVDVFAMLAAQSMPAALVSGLILVPMYQAAQSDTAPFPSQWGMGVWWALVIWFGLAQLAVLWRSSSAHAWLRLMAMLVLVAANGVQMWLAPMRHWYPAPSRHAQSRADAPAPFQLTQELMEAQQALLQSKLQALEPHHDRKPHLYAITFSPYADEDVFLNESRLVASVMQDRFDARGRTIQLINHPSTLREWPWATPLNLQRTIAHIARIMNRDEDVLFIHLTSHGARDGKLSADFEPLSVDSVTPQSLRQWLDQAGIRYRVISISACFSGSWIDPLAGNTTLVMTAADADHTSFGCGRGSDLTFFGRAMYDEQLRHTWSFERAHSMARGVIDRREHDAGKTDGFSNPQIKMGEAMRTKLTAMEASWQTSWQTHQGANR